MSKEKLYINTDGMRKDARSVKEGQGTRVGSMAKMLIDCCDKIDELEAEPGPGEFTKGMKHILYDSPTSGDMTVNAVEVAEKCFVEIDRLSAVLSFTKQELGAANLEIKKLRRLFVCPGCKTDRYKQIHCHLCGAKFEQALKGETHE